MLVEFAKCFSLRCVRVEKKSGGCLIGGQRTSHKLSSQHQFRWFCGRNATLPAADTREKSAAAAAAGCELAASKDFLALSYIFNEFVSLCFAYVVWVLRSHETCSKTCKKHHITCLLCGNSKAYSKLLAAQGFPCVSKCLDFTKLSEFQNANLNHK